MDIINIKVHPPWYARGTPIVNTRDGPPMALSDKPLFAIREGPSTRDKPGECRNELMHECINEDESRKTEDRSRGNSWGKTHLWLTLNLAVFNTQNRAYSRRYALLGSDLSACAAPDNVKMSNDNVKMEDNVKTETAAFFNAVKSLDVDRFEERSAVDFDLSVDFYLSTCPRWLSGLTTSK